ncbi:hypothetical protein PVK06_024174 [Gossypium arboreum]|uniref:Uncharacterized protein n=1 Tax=Gossypium arboreum TaxID=29729 RepID=A0ABR0PDH6_GOSAR|nr:hypothetical protein PVK06_024174 [Gossypium arboreum]
MDYKKVWEPFLPKGIPKTSSKGTEEESDKELNSLKTVEGSASPEPKVEPEEETVKLSVEPESTTPMLTSTNAIFETWTEDTDYASGNRAEEDKGNESEK